MLDKLSKEQEELMYQHRDEYIDFIVNNGQRSSNIKAEDVREDINWVYSKANLQAPKYIFISNSYMEEKLMINFILNSDGLLFGLEDIKDIMLSGSSATATVHSDIEKKSLETMTVDAHIEVIKADPDRATRSKAITDLVLHLENEIKNQIMSIIKTQVNKEITENSLGGTVWGREHSRIYTQVDKKTTNKTFNEVADKLFGQVRAQIDLNVTTSIADSVKEGIDKIWSTVINQIKSELKAANSSKNKEINTSVEHEVKFVEFANIIDPVANNSSYKTDIETWREIRQELFNTIDQTMRSELGLNVAEMVENGLRGQFIEGWGDIIHNIDSSLTANTITRITSDIIFNFLYMRVCREIERETIENMKGKKMQFIEQEFGVPWNSWLSFYSYFQKIGIVTSQDFDRYYKFMRKGIWSIQFFKHWCILTPLPNKIHRDNQNRLHSTDSSAVEWIGSKHSDHHFIHGVSFPDKSLWERVVTGKITAREVLTEIDNMEQRNAILSVFAPDKMINELEAELIDTHIQKKRGKELLKKEDYRQYKHKPIKLYKIDPRSISTTGELSNEVIYILFYTDPSTGREYFSYIDPRVAKDAASAMAWKFGLSKEDYLNNVVAET